MSLPVPQGGANWVQLRVELGCVQCGNRSALNTLSEGVYFCTSCQADRKFDVDLWHEKIIPLSSETKAGSRTPRTATIPNPGIPNPPIRRNDKRGGFRRDQTKEPYSAYGDDSQPQSARSPQ